MVELQFQESLQKINERTVVDAECWVLGAEYWVLVCWVLGDAFDR